MRDVRELSDRTLLVIATGKHLHQVNLGDAMRGVVCVVIALGIDHQRVKQSIDLARNLDRKFIEFAIFDERGDVVIRVKASTRRTSSR